MKLTQKQIEILQSKGITEESLIYLNEEQINEALQENFIIEDKVLIKHRGGGSINNVIDDYVSNSESKTLTREELKEIIMYDNSDKFFRFLSNGKIVKLKDKAMLNMALKYNFDFECISKDKNTSNFPAKKDLLEYLLKQWSTRANNIVNEIKNPNHAKFYNSKNSTLKYKIKDLENCVDTFEFIER